MKIIYILISSMLVLQVIAQNSQVTWSSFDMGFVDSKSNNVVVKSIAGQNFVGLSGYGNNFILSGFLTDILFRSVFVNVNEQIDLPATYALHQNYPNPFNPSTTIEYEIPKESFVTLKVFNLLGQEVATLVDETKQAGRYEVKFNGLSLSSGVYFYKIRSKDFIETKKLILVR